MTELDGAVNFVTRGLKASRLIMTVLVNNDYEIVLTVRT